MLSLSRPLRSLAIRQAPGVLAAARSVCAPAISATAAFDPTIGANSLQANQQVRHRSNRSRRGLYDGKDIRSGNNVSFSMRTTKRNFKPNVFIKKVYSEILDDMIQFHLTASALRSIDKAGGLDNYLLNNKNIVEGEGFEIKQKILKRLKNQARMDRKAAEALVAGAATGAAAPAAASSPTL
jgi:large subunit ribosomal protein L28